MEELPFQFRLKGMFKAIAAAAALMAIVHYVPALIPLLVVVVLFYLVVSATVIAGYVRHWLCVEISRLFREPQPPDNRPFR